MLVHDLLLLPSLDPSRGMLVGDIPLKVTRDMGGLCLVANLGRGGSDENRYLHSVWTLAHPEVVPENGWRWLGLRLHTVPDEGADPVSRSWEERDDNWRVEVLMSDWQARLLNTLAFFVWLAIGTLALFMPLLYGIYVEVGQ